MSTIQQPRGIRNHNPGNIRHNPANKWRGLSAEQADTDFAQFDTPEFGIRALCVLLRNYEIRHGLNTVRGIISRYAPPCENNTDAYIDHVCKALGVSADDVLDLNSEAVMMPLVKSIILHENGIQPYTDGQIQTGMQT